MCTSMRKTATVGGGTRDPVSSAWVMDDAIFLRGRYNVEEDGAKGIDIDSEMSVLVTCGGRIRSVTQSARAVQSCPR